MFLKSIEIFGFKSFADKSKIEFGDGISTIVGPNGCGKSNVVDAIRWVLGEQSSKGLRLEKMDNVIFNGTDQRHPLNVAEVTLTFSNEQGILPFEFSEVAIKRRIFRASSSEYFINGVLVPLKELRELLADTGIGITEYIVMEQGRIDQIIESKPVDRRSILEEAAGIKKYRIRSQEGNRRREKVRENIVQIEQILYEVEKQHTVLKQQSEKAIRYRTLSDVVFSCEVSIACKKHNECLAQLHKAKEKLDRCLEKLEKETAIHNELTANNSVYRTEIQDGEQTLVELQKRMSVLYAEKDALKRMIKANQEHIKEIKIQHNNHKTQRTNLVLRKTDQEKELSGFGKEREAQQTQLQKISASIEDNKGKIANNRQEISKLLEQKRTLVQRENHIRIALETHQQELRAVVDRLAEELDKRISQSGYSASAQNRLEAEVLAVYQQFSQQINTLLLFIKDASISSDQVSIAEISGRIESLQTFSSKAETAFFSYRDSMPIFLNEFLENDGVLAHKHVIDEKIRSLHKDQEDCRIAHESIENKTEELNKDIASLQELIHEMEIQKNAYIQNLEILDKDEHRLAQAVKESEVQIEKEDKQLDQLLQSLEKWQVEYKEHETLFAQLVKEDEQTQKRIDVVQKDIGKRNKEVQAHQIKLEKSQSKMREIQQEIQSVEKRSAEMDARLHIIQENFRDRHGEFIQIYLNNSECQKKCKQDLESIKDTLQDTKEQITKLGSVNLLAAEEFETVDSRYQHLNTQLSDLYEADTHLQEVVAAIEKESREKMEYTYAEVRKHFKIIFKRVMGGGKADIRLVDSDDILSAGIDIIAQPPEKNTQYLSQLSGGERTLIALSLLFALHSVKPAPFCLLDELDAPLDDSNIDKFLDLLHSFKEQTQFVVISHNKRSIAQSKNIIGVTMEERGVSKFIGVNIENYVQ